MSSFKYFIFRKMYNPDTSLWSHILYYAPIYIFLFFILAFALACCPNWLTEDEDDSLDQDVSLGQDVSLQLPPWEWNGQNHNDRHEGNTQRISRSISAPRSIFLDLFYSNGGKYSRGKSILKIRNCHKIDFFNFLMYGL